MKFAQEPAASANSSSGTDRSDHRRLQPGLAGRLHQQAETNFVTDDVDGVRSGFGEIQHYAGEVALAGGVGDVAITFMPCAVTTFSKAAPPRRLARVSLMRPQV